PVQVSATSHGPAAARQTAPALPAGCWQASFVPSRAARLHGLPSSVHAVPAGCFVSAGQLGPFPGQFSAGSHSPAEARQTVDDGLKASAGHVVLVPVQVSATSHGPAVARQTAPALPAGCWQASFVPSHSSRLHGLPSSVHAVPAGCFASAGQLGPFPGQFSAGSHSPAEARQTVDDGLKASAGPAALVPVQVSATSHGPAEARHTVLEGSKASAGHAVLVRVQVSATSHGPAVARQTAPALPAGCWQASFV